MRAEVAVKKVVVKHDNINGYKYTRVYVQLPQEMVDKLKLNRGDYVIITVAKAEWWHLVELKENGFVFKGLPPEIQRQLKEWNKMKRNGAEIKPVKEAIESVSASN